MFILRRYAVTMSTRNVCSSLALCLVASAAPAQQPAEVTPREMVSRQFEASGLKVGSEFPDLQIYDAAGKPFQTSELRGGYSVLVTGCLT